MRRQPSLARRITRTVFSLSLAGAFCLYLLFVVLAFVYMTRAEALLFAGVGLGALSLFAILAFFVARASARRLIAPLSPDMRENGGEPYVELSPLFERLSKQDAAIEKQLLSARRRQEEFRVLSENMDEGLVVADRHGAIVSANAVARAFMEAGKEGDVIHEVLDVARSGRHTERSLAYGGRYYRVIGSPVLYNELIVGAVSLLLDETEKRSMEQYRKEFTANVSHELKTPLTSISGFAELLMNGMVAPEDIPEFGADIYAEAKRLLTLVNDIIRLSRLEDGSRPYENGEVDLYATAEAALSTVRPAAERAHITLSLEGAHEIVMGAEPILYDVIYNLCDNAVKYNREGGFVRVYVGEGEMGTVVTVTDSGIGIPSEHIDRIFERFYRVDKSHSKEIGGTGLGLSIVRHGVAYHGGEVSLASTEGEGTTVTVTLKKERLLS
jgi:two-component system phosphate regulon sensor histidine kinase PhoR